MSQTTEKQVPVIELRWVYRRKYSREARVAENLAVCSAPQLPSRLIVLVEHPLRRPGWPVISLATDPFVMLLINFFSTCKALNIRLRVLCSRLIGLSRGVLNYFCRV